MSNRDETQQKAFLRWANIVLSKHPGELPQIEDLVHSIQDGLTLGHLAEAVIPTKLKLTKPKNDLIRVQNITTALNSFENTGLKLVNIHSSAVARGDKKTILGLMFQLCIHFQVQAQSAESTGGKSVSVAELKLKLIEWMNEILQEVDPQDNLTIRVIGGDVYSEQALHCTHLDKSLVDGTILIGLIAALIGPQFASNVVTDMGRRIEEILEGQDKGKLNAILSKIPDPSTLTKHQTKCIVNNSVAMDTALQLLEIPLLMDPEDIVLNGDSGANLAYLSYFHNIDIDHAKIADRASRANIDTKGANMIQILKENGEKPPPPTDVKTLDTFDPDVEYDDDVILFL